MAFEFVKKHFPIKASSLENFIELIDRKKSAIVTVELSIGPNTVINNGAPYSYHTRFRAETLTGRPIEASGLIFGPAPNFAYAQKQGLSALKELLTYFKQESQYANLIHQQ